MAPKIKRRDAKPRRRRRLLPPRQYTDATAKQQRLDSGAALLRCLISLYALCKLSAQDFCVICFHCVGACVEGADFEKYSYPAGKQTGRYRSHLDTVLPPAGPLYFVPVPVWQKGGAKETRDMPVMHFPSRIQQEVEQDRSILDILDRTVDLPDIMRTEAYKRHPITEAARVAGERLPLPLAFYLDGVAFTSNLGGGLTAS